MKSYSVLSKYLKAVRYLVLISILLSAIRPVEAITGNDLSQKPLDIICAIYDAFTSIAVALAALIVVVGGVTWIASHDNPGNRNKAKSAIIHAVIGLIIVSIAAELIGGIDVTTASGGSAGTLSSLCL